MVAQKRLKKEVFAQNMENVPKLVAQTRLEQEVFAENTADDCTTNA